MRPPHDERQIGRTPPLEGLDTPLDRLRVFEQRHLEPRQRTFVERTAGSCIRFDGIAAPQRHQLRDRPRQPSGRRTAAAVDVDRRHAGEENELSPLPHPVIDSAERGGIDGRHGATADDDRVGAVEIASGPAQRRPLPCPGGIGTGVDGHDPWSRAVILSQQPRSPLGGGQVTQHEHDGVGCRNRCWQRLRRRGRSFKTVGIIAVCAPHGLHEHSAAGPSEADRESRRPPAIGADLHRRCCRPDILAVRILDPHAHSRWGILRRRGKFDRQRGP